MKIGKIAREGIRFFIILNLIALALIGSVNFISCTNRAVCYVIYVISGLLSFIGFFSLAFFRNPARIIPDDERFIVSPADGKVVRVETVSNPYTGQDSTIISVFMSVFNVHINRNPISGTIENIEYKKGSFMNAASNEASIRNEQNMVYINGKIKLVVVQIAGLIARRIKCFVSQGQEVTKGDYLGLIQFGSRLDITVPSNVRVVVGKGDKVSAGSSILGEII